MTKGVDALIQSDLRPYETSVVQGKEISIKNTYAEF